MEDIKIKTYPNATVTMEKLFPSGMYVIRLRVGGKLTEKVRCESYGNSMDHFRRFCVIAETHEYCN